MEPDISLNCCICYNTTDKKKYVMTSCDHYFCTDCFFTWLLEKPSCPLCRKAFTKPPEKEALEDLENIYIEIEEYSNYRSILARNIIYEEGEYNKVKIRNNTLKKANAELQSDNIALISKNNNLENTQNNIKHENVVVRTTHTPTYQQTPTENNTQNNNTINNNNKNNNNKNNNNKNNNNKNNNTGNNIYVNNIPVYNMINNRSMNMFRIFTG